MSHAHPRLGAPAGWRRWPRRSVARCARSSEIHPRASATGGCRDILTHYWPGCPRRGAAVRSGKPLIGCVLAQSWAGGAGQRVALFADSAVSSPEGGLGMSTTCPGCCWSHRVTRSFLDVTWGLVEAGLGDGDGHVQPAGRLWRGARTPVGSPRRPALSSSPQSRM